MEGALVLVMSRKLLVISFTDTFISNSLPFKYDKFVNQKQSLAKYCEMNIQIMQLSPSFLNMHDANCNSKETNNNLERNGFVFINEPKSIMYIPTGLYPGNAEAVGWRGLITRSGVGLFGCA